MKKYYLYLISLILLSVLPGAGTNPRAQDADEKLMIAGTVMTDQGEALAGVNVYLKDYRTGVVTDLDGKFRLRNIPRGATVIFSFIGYLESEMKVTQPEERLKIVLKPSINELDEAVVVGHGTQRKITTTGAITTVDAGQLQVPASSLSNMLAGRVPGLSPYRAAGSRAMITRSSGSAASARSGPMPAPWC